MLNIAIIGAGQIGSRHLQALSFIEKNAVVQMVDPSEKSLQLSKVRFLEALQRRDHQINLSFHKTIDTIKDNIDVALVATSSNVRADVTEELITKKKVKHLVLEKVLFQKPADYSRIQKLLSEKRIPAWVNCYMREKEFYKEFKKQFGNFNGFSMQVSGSLWGLCCNTIHFVDLMSFLTEDVDYTYDISKLEPTSIDSKRPGFKELLGTISIESASGHKAEISCTDGSIEENPITIKIQTDKSEHTLVDHLDYVDHTYTINGQTINEIAPLPYQSQTTHRIIHTLINDATCDLSTYESSMKMHLPMIKAFMEHFEIINNEPSELCPIT